MTEYQLPANLTLAQKRIVEVAINKAIHASRHALLEGIVEQGKGLASSQVILSRVTPLKRNEVLKKASALLAEEKKPPFSFKSETAGSLINQITNASASAAWKGPAYAAICLDYIRCIKKTNDGSAHDEIAIGGVWFDVGASQTDKVPPQYLGQFKTGDVVNSNRKLWRVRLNDAVSYPTGAKAILFLAEQDLSGGFVDMVTEIHKRLYDFLKEELKGIGDDSGWWEVLRIGILQSIVATFSIIKQLLGDEVFLSPVEISSPLIHKASNADETWGGDNRSATVKFTVADWGGKYELGLYWRRED